ncbi:MAG: hypothetical protein INR71_02865 [Terriglobus roseus]|nr:hypothetical protein [Terriglobus roseus]
MLLLLVCLAAVFVVLGLKKRTMLFCLTITFYYAFHRSRKNPTGSTI